MELLLLILKIILIVFLSVLGIFLFLVGLILLVPIRYEISGSVGDSWEIKLQGKITYLLSIVKVLFSYEKEQFDVNFFLFGFKKRKLQEDASTESEAWEDSKEDDNKEDDNKEDNKEKEQPLNSESVSDVLLEEDSNTENWNSDMEIETQTVSLEKQEEVQSVSKAQKQSGAKKKRKGKKEQKNISEQKKIDFNFLKKELTDEHNKSVVRKVLVEIGYLFRHFKFRKIETDIVFSAGDPAVTGQALGVLCMLPLFYQHRFGIVPDFEAETFYIKGTFLVAGKVRLIHILITALRLILDKEVRLVVKKILTLLEK